MKKILVLTLAILMCFGCVACGSEKQISHGTVENNVYTSEFTGITFTAPSGWTYLSEDEIAELMNTTADVFTDDKFAEAVKDLDNFTDMMVTDPQTGTNVNVLYENLVLSGNSKITEEEYLDVSIEQMKNAMAGISVELVGSEDATLSGANYLRAELKTTASGISMSQYLYMRKVSNYMVVVTVTITSGYELADLEAMFS